MITSSTLYGLIIGFILIFVGISSGKYIVAFGGAILMVMLTGYEITHNYMLYIEEDIQMISTYQKSYIVVGSALFIFFYTVYRLIVDPAVDMDGKIMNYMDIPFVYFAVLLTLTFSQIVPQYFLDQ
jgi:hypothetical protein